MNITSLTPKQLRRAADIQERIQSLQSELTDILGGEAPIHTPAAGAPRKRRRMSAAGRAAIAAAARARWARIKGTAPSTKPARKGQRKMSARGLANIRAGVAKRMAAQGKAPAVKPKRKMSAAGRAALSLAAKARWRKAKMQGKTTL